MGFLQNIDEWLFYLINKTLANPVTDKLMPFITDIDHWKIFYAIMWLYLVIAGGRRGRIVAFLALLLVFCTDQLSSTFIKHLIERARPCNVLPNVNLLVPCTGSFSFPSSHAVNNFGGAVFLSHFYPRLKYAFFTGAFLMAISRVFCGVHYPFDVLGGMIIGSIVGWAFITLWKGINKKLKIL